MKDAVRYRIRHETAYEYAQRCRALASVAAPGPAADRLSTVPGARHQRDARPSTASATRSTPSAISSPGLSSIIRIASSKSRRTWKSRSIRAPPWTRQTAYPWERAAAELTYRRSGPPRDNLEAASFRHESPYVRIKTLFNDYARRLFPARPAGAGCAQAADEQAAHGLALCAGRNHVSHAAHRSVEKSPRRVPGLRAPDDCVPALSRSRRALCQRLYPRRSRQPRCARRLGRIACLGRRVYVRRSAGSSSIPPTTSSSEPTTSRSRGAATSAMSRRCAASSSAAAAMSCPSMSRWNL